MKNLRKIGVSIFLICITISGIAQSANNKEAAKEKMAAVKVGYLTEKLNLSEEEASVFWPIYNQEKEELTSLMSSKEEKTKPEELSDAELEKKIYAKFEIQKQRLQIQESYVQKYIEVIGIQKVAKLYKAEQDFKKEILQKLRKDQGQGKMPPQKQ